MILTDRGTRKPLVAAVLLLCAFGMAACAKKVATVDPSFTTPEGVPSSLARMVLWREFPNYLFVFEKAAPSDPQEPDILLEIVQCGADLPERLHGAIFDSTAANAFQVWRSEPNGGVRALFDFASAPTRRWVDREWESYTFTDNDTTTPSRIYTGRGVVAGAVTAAAPVTNAARDTVRVFHIITYTGKIGTNAQGLPEALDSLFVMEWLPVPGATAYYIQVYQPSANLTGNDEQLRSGVQAPVYLGKSKDFLVAYIPAPADPNAPVSFRMPTPGARLPSDTTLMTVRQTNFGQTYRVRIAAVDPQGELLGFTLGSLSQKVTDDVPCGVSVTTTQYAVYPLGAVEVTTSRPLGSVSAARARPIRSGPQALSPIQVRELFLRRAPAGAPVVRDLSPPS